MYAIVKDGTSQLRVEKGSKVRLALRADAEPDSVVTLTDVLLVGSGDDGHDEDTGERNGDNPILLHDRSLMFVYVRGRSRLRRCRAAP